MALQPRSFHLGNFLKNNELESPILELGFFVQLIALAMR
ncbi:hypothetical protein J921_0206 [Acinetobacter baumannii 25493_8]|nr:hypothetical protein J470_0982 [Acinetobacter baumannii 1032241]EXC65621.1 hypothetical protein J489_0061 [Acinetobacter baumannii 1040094]EXD03283.1 hypothetical protein J495_0988 [Acinetobacter baumannii 1075025]EXD45472.1 hypothetical protein J487_0323 [Acinetobacter baumannii 562700]EXE85018.1 hypothetical protein J590_1394 [Acinetobacter baumannii 42887]EYD30808.1 hypothetical protein J922_1087 [Acinetobacter baumannii 25493_9]EYD38948.1 hypothetical protein J921_0206 [Acinetobacter b